MGVREAVGVYVQKTQRESQEAVLAAGRVCVWLARGPVSLVTISAVLQCACCGVLLYWVSQLLSVAVVK